MSGYDHDDDENEFDNEHEYEYNSSTDGNDDLFEHSLAIQLDLLSPQVAVRRQHTDAPDTDDLVAVSTTQSALGGTGADRFVVRELGDLVIDDFDRTENDKLVFDTGLGLSSVEHLAQYITSVRSVGDDWVFEFGQGVSIQIVGGVSRGIDADDVLVLS